MRTSPECRDCLKDSFSSIVQRTVRSKRDRDALLRKIPLVIDECFDSSAPCDIGTRLNLLVMEHHPDPLRKEKKLSERAAKKILSSLDRDDRSLRYALRVALLGNILDFLVKGWDHREMEAKKLIEMPIRLDHSEQLEKEIDKARTILFLTDNAGEVILDTFLLRYLKGKGKMVILSPKCAPIQNDATVKDVSGRSFIGCMDSVIPAAQAVGLDLEKSSAEFREAFASSDLVILKGMGYFENAFDKVPNGFFILKAKCAPVAKELGVHTGDNAVAWNRLFRR